ncbi:MAG: hypothetical protein IJ794_11790 [Lachnospiraceae bacterium]|nr:hypothetical protein [Lachnospiraceae bacterium]
MSYDEGVLAALGAFICVVAVIALVWAIIVIVATWKVFTKAGEPGWKAIIPFYNYYTQIKLCAPVLIFWIYLGCTIVGSILNGFDNTFCSILSLVASLAAFVMSVFGNLKLSKAFGHGVGFAVGLILLNPIFMLILGFGDSQYDPMVDKETWY